MNTLKKAILAITTAAAVAGCPNKGAREVQKENTTDFINEFSSSGVSSQRRNGDKFYLKRNGEITYTDYVNKHCTIKVEGVIERASLDGENYFVEYRYSSYRVLENTGCRPGDYLCAQDIRDCVSRSREIDRRLENKNSFVVKRGSNPRHLSLSPY